MAEGLKENGVVFNLDCLVLEGPTPGNVMSVRVLDLNLDRVQVLGPLEGWAHQDGLALFCLEPCESGVVVGPH